MEMSDRNEDSQSDSGEASAYRRSNKPLMEKRRRARINDCLIQLKALVLQAMRKDKAQYSKLEKADILEMTVKHLRQLQRHNAVPLVARETEEYVSKFRVGFNECANEVVRFLKGMDTQGTEIRTRLLNHLAGCMETSTAMSANSDISNINQLHHQPLRVSVPQHENISVGGLNNGVPLRCQTYPGINADHLVMTAEDLSNSSMCSPHQRGSRVPLGQIYLPSRDIQNNQNYSHSDSLPGQTISPSSGSRLLHVSEKRHNNFPNQSSHPYQHVIQRHVPRNGIDCSPPPYDLDYAALHCGSTRTPSPLELGTDKLWRPW